MVAVLVSLCLAQSPVSVRDQLDKLQLLASSAAETGRAERHLVGAGALLLGAGSVGLGAVNVARQVQQHQRPVSLTDVVAGAVLFGAGAFVLQGALFSAGPEEDVLSAIATLQGLKLETQLTQLERALEVAARRAALFRKLLGGGAIGLGLAWAVTSFALGSLAAGVEAALLAGFGVVMVAAYRTPLELAWTCWQDEARLSKVALAPWVAPMRGGLAAGAALRF